MMRRRSGSFMRATRLALLLLFAVGGAAGCADTSKMSADAPASGGYDVQAVAGVAAGYPMEAPAAPPADLLRSGAELERVVDADDEYAKAPKDLPKQQPSPGKAPPAVATKGGEGAGGNPGAGNGPGPGGVVADPARKQPILIYRAEFSLSVYEVQKSLDAVDGLAKDAGGYLSRRDDHSITIRVPAERFQGVVDASAKVGDVLHRDVVSEDVTAEYRDLEVQLANLIALRARFEKLLEKAAKVEEALAIEQQLGRVTGEIERIKGRLKLLGDQARYSTITVRFEARSNQQVQQGPFVLPLPWLNQVGLRRLMSL